jgi:cobalamin biosynthesis Mg chelatase CobN
MVCVAPQVQYLAAYFDDDLPLEVLETVSSSASRAGELRRKMRLGAGEFPRLEEAATIRDLLLRNTEEIASALKALNGEFILPEAGGDLLRDGPGVI